MNIACNWFWLLDNILFWFYIEYLFLYDLVINQDDKKKKKTEYDKIKNKQRNQNWKIIMNIVLCDMY